MKYLSKKHVTNWYTLILSPNMQTYRDILQMCLDKLPLVHGFKQFEEYDCCQLDHVPKFSGRNTRNMKPPLPHKCLLTSPKLPGQIRVGSFWRFINRGKNWQESVIPILQPMRLITVMRCKHENSMCKLWNELIQPQVVIYLHARFLILSILKLVI